VGAPNALGGVGSASVFDRTPDGGWIEAGGSPVSGIGYTNTSSQGAAVALSGEGYTLAVGGPNDAGGLGAVWVFERNFTDNSWIQLSPPLLPPGTTGTTNPNFGSSVALSLDGNVLVVGAPSDGDGVGSVFIYTKTGFEWALTDGPLVGSGGDTRQVLNQ